MKKILIVEDDVFLGDILNQKIQRENFDVCLVKDGKDGYDQMGKFKPDLILLDILLPSMNGYEFLEKKQQDPNFKDIPVIVISNSGQPVEIERTTALGVKDYLIKALFNPAELMIKVRKYLGGQSIAVEESVHDYSDELDLSGVKVLWVEDDKFLNHLIEKKFPSFGCILKQAKNGKETFEFLKEMKPDIIVLDIILPDMNGYEVLQKLKSNNETKNIPVVLLSNIGQQSEIDKGLSMGAEKFIIKATFTFAQIVEQLKEVLDNLKNKQNSTQ